MDRFAALSRAGRLVELAGWGMLGLRVLHDGLLLAEVGVRVHSLLQAPGTLAMLLFPVWVGLLTVAFGHGLRGLALIGRTAQESAAQLAQIRRALSERPGGVGA